MKYLKLINAPLNILKGEKYNGKTDDIEWGFCGFNQNIVSVNTISYTSLEGDFIQYLPISDEVKLNAILGEFRSDLLELGGNRSADIVEDDREAWLIESKKKEDDKQVIINGFTLEGNTYPIDDFLYFTQLIRAGKASLVDADVSTVTLTIPHATGTVEMDLQTVNKVLAALETIHSNSLKVRVGSINFSDIESPLVIL